MSLIFAQHDERLSIISNSVLLPRFLVAKDPGRLSSTRAHYYQAYLFPNASLYKIAASAGVQRWQDWRLVFHQSQGKPRCRQ